MLTTLLIAVIVFGIVAYVVQLLPIEAPFKQVAYLIVLGAALIYFLKFLPAI